MLTFVLTASMLSMVLVGVSGPLGIDSDKVVASITTQGVKGRDPTQVLRSIEQLRESLTKGGSLEDSAREELFNVVANAHANGLVRIATLRLLCDYASAESAEGTVDLLASLLQRLRRPNSDQDADSESNAITALLHTFVTEGAKALDSCLRDPAILLEFYASILEDQGFHFEHIRSGCLARIADSRAPLVVRQTYMLRIIETMSNDSAPDAFFTLVNDDVMERLRRIAFEDTSAFRGYNAAAMGLLAEYGDMETARWVRDWAKQLGYDEAAVTRVGGYVWTIESQHKPKMLVDHIRSTEWINSQTRLWALKKAMRLKVDRVSLRIALMEHFRQVGSKRIVESAEIALSNLAVESGIVKPEDLPEVTLSPQDESILEWRRAFEATRPKKEVVKSDND